MKILALNWQDLTNPLAGGAEVHLEELLRRLAAKGHDITLFCSSYLNAAPEETIEGVKIIRRGKRHDFNLIAPFHLRRMVKETHYDVMIEDINKIPFYTPIYLDIPTLVVVPHLFSTTVFREINFLLGLYIYFSEKPLVRIYRRKKFNVISESTKEDIVARGIPADSISVIHCGIDTDEYSFDPSLRKFDRPTILYLGRIKKYKSVDHMILAFAKILDDIPDAQMYIVGSGGYIDPLKELAGKLKIKDKVYFPGFVDSAQKVEYLRRSHVAVYPSLKEGWGLTNIEANACGTAVIAANVPGLKNSVDNDNSGYLYEYGNIDELAQKMKKILTDPEERGRLEKGGLKWAAQFNWDDAADAFEKELEKVIAQGR